MKTVEEARNTTDGLNAQEQAMKKIKLSLKIKREALAALQGSKDQ